MSGPLRVVHVVRQFSPQVGGLEDAVGNLARAQRDRLGVDAAVVTLDRVFGSAARLPRTDEVGGVPVRRIGWRGSPRYPVAPAALRHLGGADLVHVHAVDFFWDFLALTRPLHGVPMVASTHGGFFHSGRFRTLKTAWFHTVTRCTSLAYRRVVACGSGDAALFAPVVGRRLVTIENGIDREKFGGASSPVPRKTIVSFGRFARHKRIETLLDLLRELRARDGDWRLILAGRDADQTENELRRAVAARGLADAVRFVVGPDDAALRAVIGEADYFACLSAHEGFGIAAVEALSAGLFPLLSAIAPFRRLRDATGVGLLVEPHALAAAAETIVRQHPRHPAEHARSRAAAMEASRGYDWTVVAGDYVALYRDVLSAAPAARGRRLGEVAG